MEILTEILALNSWILIKLDKESPNPFLKANNFHCFMILIILVFSRVNYYDPAGRKQIVLVIKCHHIANHIVACHLP